MFQSPEGLLLRNAGVRYTVQPAVQQRLLVGSREVSVVRNALVVGVSDQVHDVFLQVRAGATDDGHFVLANHFGEASAQFRGAHRTGERNHHFAACGQMSLIPFGSILECRGVEMFEVARDKIAHV